jgi:hypothetical protein
MNRTIRVHVHIDQLQLSGADLVHRHELASQISAQLSEEFKALLQPGTQERTVLDALNHSRCVTLGAVRAGPLGFQGALRPAPLGRHIAKQVANATAPAIGLQAGSEMTAADRGKV